MRYGGAALPRRRREQPIDSRCCRLLSRNDLTNTWRLNMSDA